ncbi:hypothetical protein BC939DRAFT_67979 [Gamsiella multidivaricata]|uniref:uncharacterized protein n=1 Tax=Gamsiella multidivaricata TaxID=101098 RepID=UPI00221F0951|nr:uncharacterized protein BC939DRAFT_67979 [Gamsiella multidivaricata]KAI7828110.1 hypothetical protein BC939DRAFT_67979 [Gamsiella multidivaricata]
MFVDDGSWASKLHIKDKAQGTAQDFIAIIKVSYFYSRTAIFNSKSTKVDSSILIFSPIPLCNSIVHPTIAGVCVLRYYSRSLSDISDCLLIPSYSTTVYSTAFLLGRKYRWGAYRDPVGDRQTLFGARRDHEEHTSERNQVGPCVKTGPGRKLQSAR